MCARLSLSGPIRLTSSIRLGLKYQIPSNVTAVLSQLKVQGCSPLARASKVIAIDDTACLDIKTLYFGYPTAPLRAFLWMILILVVGDLLECLVAIILEDFVSTCPKPSDKEAVSLEFGRGANRGAVGCRYNNCFSSRLRFRGRHS